MKTDLCKGSSRCLAVTVDDSRPRGPEFDSLEGSNFAVYCKLDVVGYVTS